MSRRLLTTISVLVASRLALAADFQPVLQWVKSAESSGTSSVASAAADSQGNLFVVGSTTSLDFPVLNAAQPAPGGSTLARIDLASGSATRLYPRNIPMVTSVAAATDSPNILYAAANDQIWKSTDAGSTWSYLSQFPASAHIFNLAVVPNSPSTLYASTNTLGVQKSVDGGRTWIGVNNGIPPESQSVVNVSKVWADPSDPSVVFATNGYGLLRSASGGETWSVVGTGNYLSQLAFDSNAPGTIYLGTGNEIKKSTDDGATFTHILSLPNQAGVITLALDPRRSGVLYAGTGTGLFQSTDGGSSWKLQIPGATTVIAVDPNSGALYADSGDGIVKSADGFHTVSPVGLALPSVTQLLLAGSRLFAVSTASSDVFVLKFDKSGNIVYSTYLGGSGNDQASAATVSSDGSIYITGSTTSFDLPVTSGAYLSKAAANSRSVAGFVAKLSSVGTLQWATYFPEGNITSISVDSAGNPFIAGSTSGGLPTTPGAYQTEFKQTYTFPPGSITFFGVPGPTSAFVTKFNAQGSALIYSTYIPFDPQKNAVQKAGALAVDAAGNAWVGVATNNTVAPTSGIPPSVVELNPMGSAIVASAVLAGLGSVASLALDADSNVYIAGSYGPQVAPFPATPGAFQAAPQPVLPPIPGQSPAGGNSEAFVAKWDHSLTHLLAATLLGGESTDVATSVAVDPSGNVIVAGYTDSTAFPTRLPFQESFSTRSGFLSAFDPNLSSLRFSTYLGDGRPFSVSSAVVDGSGRILLAGSVQSSEPGGASTGSLVVANQIALVSEPTVHLDSVQNYAGRLARPLAPGESILALGAGFGATAQIVLDGTPLTTVASTGASIVAVVPETTPTSGVHTIQVASDGALSNYVYVPAAVASPAIYTLDGSGVGQAYVLNSDGSPNSPSNPASAGSAITILIAGAGPVVLSDGYAVTPEPPAVFIDGFYCNGIAARLGPVEGLPGLVYQLSVFVPDPAALVTANPDLKNFKFPARSSIQVRMRPASSLASSQDGVFINIK